MIGYSVQNTLLVKYARNIDGLSLAFYRNISFIVTLFPLLLFSSSDEILEVLAHWKILLLSGATGGIFLATIFTSYRYIGVSTSVTIVRAATTILMTFFGLIIYGEILSPLAFSLIGLIVLASIWLSVQKSNFDHLTEKLMVGILLTILASIFVVVTKIALVDLSRSADALTSGYFWEISIGISTMIILFLRWILFKKGLQKIDRKTYIGIVACTSPTLIGTGCYALALSTGSIALVSSIGSGSLFVTGFLAWALYGEKLKKRQWFAMVIIILAIISLKFV